ncbi:hypothetical protein NVP1236O_34 [Vibrio phage 1.236.O._10N.261.52.C4]|nr:hypothetical protein NVP1236O_34 [Vibrio phage 1.236.O._10N.261.52.C4]
MIEFIKQHRAKCAKEAKALSFWYSSRNEDLMG